MELKHVFTEKTSYSTLDLLGKDEVALSKAFAYLLSSDANSYFQFLRFLGIKIKNTSENYFNAKVLIEKKRNEGRTDIELSDEKKYHIIIECKINKGKVIKQRTQYLTAFENVEKKVLCVLTQEKQTNIQIGNDVIIKNTNWLEIIELFNNKKFIKNPIVKDFLKFASKNYKMRQLKEILIQDLNNKTEISRFNNFNVYRRYETFGTPIYFAPYFNRGSGEIEGITKLSKILGILTFKPQDIENIKSDLDSFSSNQEIKDKWIAGIKWGADQQDFTLTYYFLDDPLIFKSPLRKDGGIQPGRGKNWIAAKIPSNRCVSFIDFIKHIPELM